MCGFSFFIWTWFQLIKVMPWFEWIFMEGLHHANISFQTDVKYVHFSISSKKCVDFYCFKISGKSNNKHIKVNRQFGLNQYSVNIYSSDSDAIVLYSSVFKMWIFLSWSYMQKMMALFLLNLEKGWDFYTSSLSAAIVVNNIPTSSDLMIWMLTLIWLSFYCMLMGN